MREFILVRFNELMFDHDVANVENEGVSHLQIKAHSGKQVAGRIGNSAIHGKKWVRTEETRNY